jgi:hypothetical protein
MVMGRKFMLNSLGFKPQAIEKCMRLRLSMSYKEVY